MRLITSITELHTAIAEPEDTINRLKDFLLDIIVLPEGAHFDLDILEVIGSPGLYLVDDSSIDGLIEELATSSKGEIYVDVLFKLNARYYLVLNVVNSDGGPLYLVPADLIQEGHHTWLELGTELVQ